MQFIQLFFVDFNERIIQAIIIEMKAEMCSSVFLNINFLKVRNQLTGLYLRHQQLFLSPHMTCLLCAQNYSFYKHSIITCFSLACCYFITFCFIDVLFTLYTETDFTE